MVNVADILRNPLILVERGIIVLTILIVTFIIAKLAKRLIDKSFKKSSKYIRVDQTQYAFLKHLASGVIYLIGVGIAIYTVPSLRTFSVSLLAGAGVLAVVIGFASQQAFSNIISGIFIAIFKPFRVGDRVTIKEKFSGVVEDITLRHTVIKGWDNKRIIIPNSIISNEVVENPDISDPKMCKYVEFGISYDSDINKAIKIMQKESMKHPSFLDNRTEEQKEKGDPAVAVRVMGFGDSSVNLRAYVWATDQGSAFGMGCDLNKNIKERFDKEGIEIPFPYRTIVYKKEIGRKKKRKN